MTASEGQRAQFQTVAVNWTDRWQVYQRLQQLSIPCRCAASQPLQVRLDDPLAAVQLWSISQQLTASRAELLARLRRCWNKHSQQGVR
ncbi:MAG: hypothetical protein BRC58_00195 [Cyanobacteria bacterium QS_8_64_29]|nr:MAG: hypothetical protein BRC58_00195 [Cyanobacteria bacterium QS_8_64_29]